MAPIVPDPKRDDAMSDQQRRTIFITGSSSGLGRASAKLFASRGWTVIATMRNPGNETELAKLPGVALFALFALDMNRAASRNQIPISSLSVSVSK